MQEKKKFLTPADYIQQDITGMMNDFDEQDPFDDQAQMSGISDSFYSSSFKNQQTLD